MVHLNHRDSWFFLNPKYKFYIRLFSHRKNTQKKILSSLNTFIYLFIFNKHCYIRTKYKLCWTCQRQVWCDLSPHWGKLHCNLHYTATMWSSVKHVFSSLSNIAVLLSSPAEQWSLRSQSERSYGDVHIWKRKGKLKKKSYQKVNCVCIFKTAPSWQEDCIVISLHFTLWKSCCPPGGSFGVFRPPFLKPTLRCRGKRLTRRSL